MYVQNIQGDIVNQRRITCQMWRQPLKTCFAGRTAAGIFIITQRKFAEGPHMNLYKKGTLTLA